jgi:hypothetical protein
MLVQFSPLKRNIHPPDLTRYWRTPLEYVLKPLRLITRAVIFASIPPEMLVLQHLGVGTFL